MKISFSLILKALAVLLTIGITGCASTQHDSAFRRIAYEDEYRNTIVGKPITSKDKKTVTTTHADGTMTGKSNGNNVVGNWTWENGFFCREGKAGGQAFERDCQMIEISGNKLKVTKNKGNGKETYLQLN